jgi:hypothetical protein
MKQNHGFVNSFGVNVIATVLFIALFLPTIATASDMKPKIGIRPSENTTPVAAVADNLNVNFKPGKEVYHVNEPIEFSVKGDRDFFLYLFSISPAGEAVLLIPGKEQEGNKYKANKTYRVPTDRKFEFYSDKPGREKIVMFASTKWINPETGSYKSKGSFLVSSEEQAEITVKGLQVRARAEKLGQNVQRINLDVVK